MPNGDQPLNKLNGESSSASNNRAICSPNRTSSEAAVEKKSSRQTTLNDEATGAGADLDKKVAMNGARNHSEMVSI
jgi:hypothetical protein